MDPGREGHDLIGEPALVGGACGPLVGRQGEPVHVIAADLPAACDHLGALALVDELVMLEVEGSVRFSGPVLGRRADGHPAHRFDAGAYGDLHGTRYHRLGREVDGLLGRPALAVDRRPRDRVGKSGRQGGVAGDVHRLLPHGHGAPHDHVFDLGRIEIVALQQGLERLGRQVDGVPPREATPSTTHRGSYGIDDHGVRHIEPL